jgi:hypothetical protein
MKIFLALLLLTGSLSAPSYHALILEVFPDVIE